MALNWNEIQTRKATRTAILSGNPVASSLPTATTPLGVTPKIAVTEAEAVPEWRIEGVSPIEVDVVSGKPPPPPKPAPVWPSKTRPEGFGVQYDMLDPQLDAQFIEDAGLTQTKPGVWEVVLGEPEPL